MTEKKLQSTLEPSILSYLITIPSCCQYSYLSGFKNIKTWKNKGKNYCSAAPPRDKDI